MPDTPPVPVYETPWGALTASQLIEKHNNGEINLGLGELKVAPADTVSATEPAPRITASTPQRDMQSRLVMSYRRMKRVGEGYGSAYVDDGPAPPWAADVAEVFAGWSARVPSMGGVAAVMLDLQIERLGARALAWCALGEPVSRASCVLAMAALWRGPIAERVTGMTHWLAVQQNAGAGRPAMQDPPFRNGIAIAPKPCAPRHFEAPITDATWEGRDRAKAASDRSAYNLARSVFIEITGKEPGAPVDGEKVAALAQAFTRFAAGHRSA